MSKLFRGERTACSVCKEVYCYDCGIQHLEEMLTRNSNTDGHNIGPADDQQLIGPAPTGGTEQF